MLIELLSDDEDTLDAGIGGGGDWISASASAAASASSSSSSSSSSPPPHRHHRRVIDATTARDEIDTIRVTLNRMYREQAQSALADGAGFPAFATRTADASVEMFNRDASAGERHAIKARCSAQFAKYVADAPQRATAAHRARVEELLGMADEATTFDARRAVFKALDDLERAGAPERQFYHALEFLRVEHAKGTLARPSLVNNLRVVVAEEMMMEFEGFLAHRMSRLWLAITDAVKAAAVVDDRDALKKKGKKGKTSSKKNQKKNRKSKNKNKKMRLDVENEFDKGERNASAPLALSEDAYDAIRTLHDVIDQFTELQEIKPFYFDIVMEISIGIRCGEVEGMREDGTLIDIEDKLVEIMERLNDFGMQTTA